MTKREIAEAMGLSEHTVQWYVKKLYEKMGVKTNAEAVARGFATGILTPFIEDGQESERETEGTLRLFGSEW